MTPKPGIPLIPDTSRLLAKATPLPWREVWEHSDPEGDYPAGIKGNDGEPNNWIVRHDDDLGTDLAANNALIVYAVNRLGGIPLIDVELLARALHELTCLAPAWDEAAARHRRWDIQSMQERVDLYRKAGYTFVRLASESSIPVEGRYGAVTGDGYAPGQKIPHNPDWSRCEAPGCHESFLLYGQHEAGLPVEEGDR